MAVDNRIMDRHTLKIETPREHDIHDLVIATHGLLSSGRSLDPIAESLTAAGYETLVWDYPSMRGSILSHASRLSAVIQKALLRPDIGRIHFVTHSMGGIISRAAIAQSRIETIAKNRCGKMLMMAPPNRGSWLTRLPLGPFANCFPQLAELSEKNSSLVNQLPRPHRINVGVIAAQKDWIVSQSATHLDGQADHAVIPTSHRRLIHHPLAIEMTLRFLAEGRLQAVAEYAASAMTIPIRSLAKIETSTQTEHVVASRQRAA